MAGAIAHNLGNVVTLTPAIIAPSAGPDLMIVFVRSTDARLLYTTRTGGIWTLPVQIDVNALTNNPPALAALPGGAALLAYRGQDGKAYWSRRPLGGSWTAPAAIAAPNVATPSAPAIAAGVGGVDAEMVFVDGATSTARHTRLTGTTWSAPAAIGGTGLTRAAISSLLIASAILESSGAQRNNPNRAREQADPVRARERAVRWRFGSACSRARLGSARSRARFGKNRSRIVLLDLAVDQNCAASVDSSSASVEAMPPETTCGDLVEVAGADLALVARGGVAVLLGGELAPAGARE